MHNFLSNLKNQNMSLNQKMTFKKTKKIIQILNLLIEEGLIRGYKSSNNDITVFLKYFKNRPVITKIILLSKPSKHLYIKNRELYNKNNKLFFISTIYGVMTTLNAKKFNVGGKLICQICL